MVWLILLLLAQGPERSREETVAEARVQIDAIDENLARLEEKLEEIRARGKGLAREIGELELQRALITNQIEKHELELEEAGAALSLEEDRERELIDQAEQQKAKLTQRLRTLYKRGPLGYAQMLLKQQELDHLIGAYHYATVMTRRDKDALEDLRETLSHLRLVRDDLERIRSEAAESRARLASRKDELDALVRARTRRLAEIRRRSSEQEALLAEMELEKEELRMLVRRLTDTDTDPMEARVSVTRYKGRLPWPTNGDILRRFGVYRDPEFKTERQINGLVMRVPKGREIETIYSGRVIFADWFKSYGNLVIIDHGDKITSFYAHCERLLVKKGDFVERDAVIALSGDTGSLEGPVLHFEIRNKTVPEDPLGWLSPAS